MPAALWVGWSGGIAWGQATDCDATAHVLGGLQSYLGGDLPGARARLSLAEQAFACGSPADPQVLVRYWLVEGAVLLEEGDAEGAADYLTAARRLSEEQWLPNLPEKVRALWSAEVPTGSGRVVIEPPPVDRPVWIDGARWVEVAAPAEVGAGLHLVQVGASETEVVFGEFVWVGPGVAAVVETSLPPLPPPPDPAPVAPAPDRVVRERPAREPTRVDVSAMVGSSVAFGTELTFEEAVEPAVLVAVPLALGLGYEPGKLLVIGVNVGGALLVDGSYLGETRDGTVVASPLRYDAGLYLGVGRRARGGLLGGVQYPGRLVGRAWGGANLVGPLYVELRAGANAPTQRRVEPAGELLVGVRN